MERLEREHDDDGLGGGVHLGDHQDHGGLAEAGGENAEDVLLAANDVLEKDALEGGRERGSGVVQEPSEIGQARRVDGDVRDGRQLALPGRRRWGWPEQTGGLRADLRDGGLDRETEPLAEPDHLMLQDVVECGKREGDERA